MTKHAVRLCRNGQSIPAKKYGAVCSNWWYKHLYADYIACSYFQTRRRSIPSRGFETWASLSPSLAGNSVVDILLRQYCMRIECWYFLSCQVCCTADLTRACGEGGLAWCWTCLAEKLPWVPWGKYRFLLTCSFLTSFTSTDISPFTNSHFRISTTSPFCVIASSCTKYCRWDLAGLSQSAHIGVSSSTTDSLTHFLACHDSDTTSVISGYRFINGQTWGFAQSWVTGKSGNPGLISAYWPMTATSLAESYKNGCQVRKYEGPALSHFPLAFLFVPFAVLWTLGHQVSHIPS